MLVSGNINELPQDLSDVLTSDSFVTPSQSQLIDGGLTQLVLRTEEKALVLKLDPKLALIS